jgi:hypothetical protein
MTDHAIRRCPARHQRPGGAQPGDRIVACHLPAGHHGDHEEADTEATWTDPTTRLCRRCGRPADVEQVEVTQLGDPEPRYLDGTVRCRTDGCGHVCPLCHRRPGDIHAAVCAPIVMDKVGDQTHVTVEDCRDYNREGRRIR